MYIRANDARLNEAYDNWAMAVIEMDHLPVKFDLFYEFLEIKDWPNLAKNGWEFTETGLSRLDSLLSPHHKTIIRAWFINKGIPWK